MAPQAAVETKRKAAQGGSDVAVKLKPLGDRVVIQPNEGEAEKSPGGIFIPDTAKEKPQKGKIVAAGPGRTTDDGKLIPLVVKVGDTVVYSKYAGTEWKEDGSEYLIVRESDILATVAAK
jgi:chaperonin GroES